MDTDVSRRELFRLTAGAGAAAAVSGTATGQTDPYNGWFDDVPNYEGTVDYSGEDRVEVLVGSGDAGLVFEPPAIQVDSGTTVVWQWTGEGGQHNVVEEDAAFESELVDDAGHEFEHTFTAEDNGDVFRYICTPHQANGMLGAVAVGDVVTETISPPADEMEEPTAGSTAESLSDEGVLATIGGVLLLALVSPVLFALFLKFVYEDDRSGAEASPPTQ